MNHPMTPVREALLQPQTPERHNGGDGGRRRSIAGSTIVSPEEVTAARKHPRISFSQDYQTTTANRTLDYSDCRTERGSSDDDDDLQKTQAFHLSHCSQFDDCGACNGQDRGLMTFVRDTVDGTMTYLHPSNTDETYHIYTIGRNSLDSVSMEVSRHHADLKYDPCDESFQLQSLRCGCYILDDNTKKWITVPPYSSHSLEVGQTFRLVPNHPDQGTSKGVEFTLGTIHTSASNLVGSAAMDTEYLRLLRTLKRKGQHQDNRKGSNRTLREPFTMSLNLQAPSRPDNQGIDNLLPVLTLRKLFPHAAVLEALWYLRGENNVQFLQRLSQKFWDKQAHAETGWTGYNYGLLTTYPVGSSKCDKNAHFINPLEENVIKPLVAGKRSRNMVCTLTKPDEDTVQQACTSSIQFAVSQNEQLDLTVTQRSSDVILGLSHDVIVWAAILHLVRREVKLRTKGNRQLQAGMLHINISAGGAHCYDINAQPLETLLHRESKPVKPKTLPPHLVIDTSLELLGLFQIANTYEDEPRAVRAKLRVCGNVLFHDRILIEQAT